VKLVSPELTQPSIVLACVGDDTGLSIENTLQLVGRLLWRTGNQRLVHYQTCQRGIGAEAGQTACLSRGEHEHV